MSFTIAVANAKGGVGKSTISMLLAASLCRHVSTVVADSDPQGTASLWAGLGHFPTDVVAVDDSNATAALGDLAKKFSAVVVDCPPNVDAPVMRAALGSADLLLVPCAPEPADAWATALLLALCRSEYPHLPVLVVMNKVPVGTALGRETLAQIEGSWPTAKSRLGLRTSYKEALALGATLDAVKGRGGRQARDELTALALEVMTKVSSL